MSGRPERMGSGSLRSGLLLVVLVFIGIPWYVGLRLLDLRNEDAMRSSAEADLLDRRDVLTRLAVLGNPEKRYDELVSQLARTPLKPDALARRAAALVKREQGALELTLFDAGLCMVPLPGLSAPPRRASERFMRALCARGEDPQPKLLAAFGGDPEAARLMAEAPGSLVKLENAFIRSWGGWWTVRTRSGKPLAHLIAFVHRGKIDPDLLMDRAVREVRRLIDRSMTVGWLHPFEPGRIRPADLSWPDDLGGAIASIPPDVGEFEWQGKPVLLVDGSRGERLFAIPRDSRKSGGESSLPAYVLSSICLALALAIVLFGPAVSIRIGLRGKLTILFASGGGLLLAGLMLTALFDRADRERILIDEFKQRHLRLLARIDEDFLSELFPALREYEAALEKAGDAGREVAADVAVRHVEPMVAKMKSILNGIIIVDAEQRVRYFASGINDPRKAGESRTFLNDVGRSLMLEFQGKAKGLSGKRQDEKLITDIIANTLYFGIRAGRQIQFQKLMNKGMIVYAGAAGSASRNTPAVLLATHDSCRAQRAYLARVSSRWPWAEEGPRFAAVPMAPDPAWTAYPKQSTGEDLELRRWRDRVVGDRLPTHGLTRIHGRDYLLTAVPGTRLEGYVLMIAQPMSRIREWTGALDRRMAALSLAILALVVGITAAVATRLLRPMRHLENALDDIRSRSFRARVPHGGVFELDRLGERVNLVSEDLRDLQIARSVQEQLWPGEEIAGPGWAVSGRCISAADLGGDYHDWAVLPDGSVMLAVGDVAGHGIPAALVTAAAKVELGMQVRRRCGPAEALNNMHGAFGEQAGSLRPMSLWLGIFDPASGVIRAASAGHPFGILALPDGTTVFVGRPAYPLGARRSATFDEVRVEMPPDSCLLLYSDGLPEAVGRMGEPFGYDRLCAAVSRLRGLPPADVSAKLLETVSEWSGASVPSDDQTVLVLSRAVHGSDRRDAA
ncbi:SpoIIE family protein phosphatase [Candidatus Ozemobacteraceae bacterium]|nr:SpoIIE family protein phosphatase [Candidatus Ozemobacteraceae bacterium]